MLKYKDYNIHPNSTFKRFGFDERSIDDFINANPDRTYAKTYIDVPTSVLEKMDRHADPGGAGKAIGIDVYDFPEFYNSFKSVKVVPK